MKRKYIHRFPSFSRLMFYYYLGTPCLLVAIYFMYSHPVIEGIYWATSSVFPGIISYVILCSYTVPKMGQDPVWVKTGRAWFLVTVLMVLLWIVWHKMPSQQKMLFCETAFASGVLLTPTLAFISQRRWKRKGYLQ